MSTRIKNFFTKSENIFCILTAAALVWILLVNPIAGVADNGDFARVLMPNFMTVTEDTSYFDVLTEEYSIINPLPIIYPSYVDTHIFPVLAAKMLNVLTYSRQIFNIRYMSLVYIILFALAMRFVLRGFKTDKAYKNIILSALFVFMFANTSNTLYFGSLYAEPAAFVFFFAAAGCLRICTAAEQPSVNRYVAALVFAFLFFGSKMQYAPLAVLMIPVSVYAVRIFREYKARIIAVTAVGVAACLSFYMFQPSYLDEVTTFDSVFCGIVTDEETAAEYLDDLGLPREYAVLAGMDGFRDEYPIDIESEEFRENFYDKVGKGTIVKFYLTHPKKFLEMLQKTADVCYENQPTYLGNRTAAFSAEKQTYTAFRHYCDLKLKLFPKNFWVIALFFAAYFAWLIYRFKKSGARGRLWLLFMMAAVVFAAIQYVLPTVGNGGADLSKQLYMFNVVLDFMLFYGIYCAFEFVVSRLSRHRAASDF